MKAFITALCTLIIIFGIIIGNYLYILNIYKSMIDSVSRLTMDSSNEVNELISYWRKRSTYIALSVPHKISDEIERNLLLLKAKLENKLDNGFFEAKELLLNSIEEMKIHAGISADSIF